MRLRLASIITDFRSSSSLGSAFLTCKAEAWIAGCLEDEFLIVDLTFGIPVLHKSWYPLDPGASSSESITLLFSGLALIRDSTGHKYRKLGSRLSDLY